MRSIKIFQGNGNIICDELVVVIDVLRASTVHYLLLDIGVKKIFLVDSREAAFELQQNISLEIPLIGESKGVKEDGFNYGNSPLELGSLSSESVIHKTSNGTKAILKASASKTVLSGSLKNLPSISNFIIKSNIKSISLVASDPVSDDDMAVAEKLKEMIQSGLELDFIPGIDFIINRIRQSKAAEKFNDPLQVDFLMEDLDYATSFKKNENLVVPILDKNKKMLIPLKIR